MNYQQMLHQGSKILKLNKINSFNLDSEILLSSSLNLKRAELLLNLDNKINDKEKKFFFNFINIFSFIK